jgi:L-fuculose-phosphate aldolase
MPLTEKEHRQQIVEVGRLVYEKGWVAANDGNITVKIDQDHILATPTGVSKGRMHPDDLLICDCLGNKLAGRLERTSEIGMHLTIYNMRPDIK